MVLRFSHGQNTFKKQFVLKSGENGFFEFFEKFPWKGNLFLGFGDHMKKLLIIDVFNFILSLNFRAYSDNKYLKSLLKKIFCVEKLSEKKDQDNFNVKFNNSNNSYFNIKINKFREISF